MILGATVSLKLNINVTLWVKCCCTHSESVGMELVVCMLKYSIMYPLLQTKLAAL
jgi:hypothetical protein